METPAIVYRAWNSMSERERAVWAAAYAAAAASGAEPALHADKVANTLSAYPWPEIEEPEYRASRLVRGLTWEEFNAWYRVESQMRAPSQRLKLSEARVREAYNVYVMCGSDFY